MTSASIISVLILSILAANLPWLTERFFFIFQAPGNKKRWWMEVMEWIVLFLIVGLMALGLEKKSTGSLHDQDWEFYAVAICLFFVFALPGIIYKHTLKSHLKH